MKLVVITGSRVWTERSAIEAVLRGADGLLVGDCETGADDIAIDVAMDWDVVTTVFCAGGEKRAKQLRDKWEARGKVIATRVISDWMQKGMKFAAGPIRNRGMAKEAAVLAGDFEIDPHAFLLGESRGTRDCIKALQESGFEAREHGPMVTAQARLF